MRTRSSRSDKGPITHRLGRAALLIVLGLIMALGQAPWGAWFLAVPALAAVLVLIATAPSARAAFGRAWLAAAAQFGLALSWIIEPFLVDIAATGWMAPFALVGMAGGMALFWAVPAQLAFMALQGRVGRLWASAGAMLAFEALRGIVFTGFPWALLGHIWIGTPVDQAAAYGGALLLSSLTLGLAAALATGWMRFRQQRVLRGAVAGLGAIAVLGGFWALGAARLNPPSPPEQPIMLRLVQGNVPQDQKWQPDLVRGFFERHLELSRRPSEQPLDLIVWPESAAPFLLENPGPGLEMIARSAGVPVVLGIDRSDRSPSGTRRFYNSLAFLDETGTPLEVYDKAHLVPFGEYIPLVGSLVEGWGGLASQVLSGYTAGPGPVVLDLGDAGLALPLICYEAIFPRNLRTEQRPDYILQITNDAWFGTWIGPYQHLAQTRLRAIEFGLPLVRAANTGVSAMIDARGRITGSLPLGQMGILDARVPGALPPTLYARSGDTPWYLLLSLGILALLWRAWRRRKAVDAARAAR